MIVMIMNVIEGCCVICYCGIVIGEVIMGVNFVCDIFVLVMDIIGGCLGVYEVKLVDVCEMVLCEMEVCVIEMGVDVVVGVDFDYEVIGQMLMVLVSGIVVELD